MKIAVDLQSCQSESRDHGIGRYSMAIVKEMIRQSKGKHEFWILLNEKLNPEMIPDIKKEMLDLLPESRIIAYQVPEPNDANNDNLPRQTAAEYIREYFIEALQPDVLYIGSFFEGINDSAITSIGAISEDINVAVTQYDIIPYLQQERYLGNSDVRHCYLKKIQDIQKADLLLCISAYSKQESEQHLNISANKIVNVSSAVTSDFIVNKQDKHTQNKVLSKYHLKPQYILYAPSGFDVRKNVEGLIKAYAKLPKSIHELHTLVLVGKLKEEIEHTILAQITELALQDNVTLTGYVSDLELIALYQKAYLFVFPSKHEGFGLPALEAMTIGIPTIGANRTSLIEVIGLEEALFDPDNTQEMADLIHKGLTDQSYRQRLIQHAKTHSKTFSWEKSAKKALEAIERLKEESTKQAKVWQGGEQNKKEYQKLIQALQKLQLTDEDKVQIANNLAHNEKIIIEAITQKKSFNWRIEGPFDSSYSLALLNRETAKSLVGDNNQVSLYPTEGPGDYQPDAQYLARNPDIDELYQNCQLQKQIEIQSRNLYPPRVHDMTAPINMLHHYAWEESAFPIEWVDDFNSYLQGMTCLSSHVEKIMIDNGVSIPLITSGCGVDHWDKITADPHYEIQAKAFRFLHVSSCFPRKGIDILLKAYGHAFTKDDAVSLVIKTFPNPHNDVEQQLKELIKKNPQYPDVQIILDDLSEAQLKGLYQQCHIMVAPSRAEGFGLPMAEAMLSNIPVITTGWGGQLDFCNELTAWLIDYDFTPASSHLPVFDSVWAEPKLEHLTELLKKTYQSTQAERDKKLKQAQQWLRTNFTWQLVNKRLQNFAQRLPINTKQPNIAWVSTWNTKCGIATYSQALIENLPQQPKLICANKTKASLLNDDSECVKRNWQENDLNDILIQAKKHNIDAIVIQFNYFFYDYNQLSQLIDGLKAHGMQVIIELHSTDDPGFAPEKALKFLQAQLKACDAILVHSVQDLNKLKKIQLIDNVILFPHGVLPMPEFSQPVQQMIQEPQLLTAIQDPDTFVIATYGFFLPHKGLTEMVRVVKELLKEGQKIYLLMLNAEYPVDVSEQAIITIKLAIKELGLEKCISLKTDFLVDEVSIAYLSQVDLIAFPYQETGEAASGAARYGITAQKPVAITPLNVFADIKDICHTLPGTDVNNLTMGLNELITQIKNHDPHILATKQKREAWYQAHLYSQVAKRLNNIIVAIYNKLNL